ncbi:hypothetical protein HII31_11892 [Pseudocercospora fuligena]|uniref:Transcription factor domain-containing protein n=1 Tax=Pseudocercospora fuligena TaxID=685502 RepID=A0A8H6R7L2_9PEZI|nr:hypothetical protein HII31_11892 [Pseudocercospora fuligena]
MTTQIYSSFLDAYLPENAPMDHDDLFREMASRPNEDAALMSALRALSLAAVGGSRKDELVVRQAGLEYGRALNLPAKAMDRPNFKPTDETLATTTVLAQCEFYNGISATGGWQKHLQGMHGMLAMGGPQNIQSRLALMLCSNSRHGALAAHLQSRRAALLGDKAWRRVLLRAPVIDETATFYNHALKVPGLLERKDNLDLQSPTIVTEIEELLDDLFEQELSLRTWFETWTYRDQLTKEKYYERRPIDDFATFAALVTDRTFAEALWFPNFPFAYLASQYWATLHRLLEDKLDLYRLLLQIDLAWQPPADIPTIESELITLADSLCMCIPYFCEPVCSLVGQVGIFLPMGVCMPYFARTQAWEKASWLLSMRRSVFVKGMIPPN